MGDGRTMRGCWEKSEKENERAIKTRREKEEKEAKERCFETMFGIQNFFLSNGTVTPFEHSAYNLYEVGVASNSAWKTMFLFFSFFYFSALGLFNLKCDVKTNRKQREREGERERERERKVKKRIAIENPKK